MKYTKNIKTKYIVIALTLLTIVFLFVGRDWLLNEKSHGPFPQIDTYQEIQHIFRACNESTLVSFDVDDTLITAIDRMANIGQPLWFKICAFFKYPELLTNQTSMEYAISIIFQQSKRFVFDPDIVHLIKELQQRKCIVVGLTSMESGTYGVIKNMPEWRANMLKDFGINFQGPFQDVSFTSFAPYRGETPCLYKGILCTNQAAKGKVLMAFLEYFHIKLTRIISFDDQVAALESIASECAKKRISFIGYQVMGAKKLYGTWNTPRALIQLDYVMKHGCWMSDKETEAMLIGEKAC